MDSIGGILQTTLKPSRDLSNTYIREDGVRCCDKCKTPVETEDIIPCFGQRMPIRCRCKKEEEELKERLKAQAEKQDKVNKLRKASLLIGRYENATFENSQTGCDEYNKAVSRCRKYCSISDEALREGYGIYLYGNSGVGKTHITACMCNELIEQGKQCLLTSFIEIGKAIRATFGGKDAEADKLIRLVSSVEFLFIDDFGTEIVRKGGEDNWLQEQIYDIINKRYNNKKPTIFSSNYDLNQLVNERGLMNKTAERVNEMATAKIKIEGTNFRRSIKKDAPF